jgi:hypothetical protein
MLNNLDATGQTVDPTNLSQKYIVNSEIQYEIIFNITLIQKLCKI